MFSYVTNVFVKKCLFVNICSKCFTNVIAYYIEGLHDVHACVKILFYVYTLFKPSIYVYSYVEVGIDLNCYKVYTLQ